VAVEQASVCERCGRVIGVEKIGSTAPALCVVCAPLLAGKARMARALAGSPYETAYKPDVSLPVVWRRRIT
jgi:hypothetical protein